jgi:hypothetical protein
VVRAVLTRAEHVLAHDSDGLRELGFRDPAVSLDVRAELEVRACRLDRLDVPPAPAGDEQPNRVRADVDDSSPSRRTTVEQARRVGGRRPRGVNC